MNKPGSDVYLPTTMLDGEATMASVVHVVGEVNELIRDIDTKVGELRPRVYWLKKDDNWKLSGTPHESWFAFVKAEIKRPHGTVEHWIEEEEVAQGLTPKQRESLKPSHLRALAAAPPEIRQQALGNAWEDAPINHFTGKKQLSASIIEQAVKNIIPPVAVEEQPPIAHTMTNASPKSTPPASIGSSDNASDFVAGIELVHSEPIHQDDVPIGTIKKGVLVPNVRTKKLYVADVDDEVELEITSDYFPALAEFLFSVASGKQKEGYLRRLSQ